MIQGRSPLHTPYYSALCVPTRDTSVGQFNELLHRRICDSDSYFNDTVVCGRAKELQGPATGRGRHDER